MFYSYYFVLKISAFTFIILHAKILCLWLDFSETMCIIMHVFPWVHCRNLRSENDLEKT